MAFNFFKSFIPIRSVRCQDEEDLVDPMQVLKVSETVTERHGNCHFKSWS
jgi:hypothetical protein